MRKRMALGTVVGALAMFPAVAAATNGNGNSDFQNAPSCEAGQIGAILDGTNDPNKHFGKLIDCSNNVPPSSSP